MQVIIKQIIYKDAKNEVRHVSKMCCLEFCFLKKFSYVTEKDHNSTFYISYIHFVHFAPVIFIFVHFAVILSYPRQEILSFTVLWTK